MFQAAEPPEKFPEPERSVTKRSIHKQPPCQRGGQAEGKRMSAFVAVVAAPSIRLVGA
jgi:hypothetical protein